MQYPTLLSKLLQCVEWNMKDEVSGAIALVNDWPMLSPAYALELLDYAYADKHVRRFAVSCLLNIRCVSSVLSVESFNCQTRRTYCFVQSTNHVDQVSRQLLFILFI